MVTNHDDSVFDHHPTTTRGFTETVNWALKHAGNSALASMSKRVYLSRDIAVTTVQEDTPVSIRIQGSSATVKALHTKLQQAYLKDDMRLVRRTTVLIDMLVHHV